MPDDPYDLRPKTIDQLDVVSTLDETHRFVVFDAAGVPGRATAEVVAAGDSLSSRYMSARTILPSGDTTGVTDEAAIQTALNLGGAIFLAAGTFYVNSAVDISVDGTMLFGAGQGVTIIKAANSTDFQTVVTGTNVDGLTLRDFEIDANQANRQPAATNYGEGLRLTTCTDVAITNVTARNTYGNSGGLPACGFAISACTRMNIVGCKLINCGVVGRPSDGIYASGDQILIIGCTAKSTLDTAFVLEKCNRSGIIGCSAWTVGCGAAITNARTETASGNFINGLTIYDWSSSVTGGIQIGNPSAVTTGDLLNITVSNVIMEIAAGSGPAIHVTHYGTAVVTGLTISNVRIKGATTQGILINEDAGSHFSIVGCEIDTGNSATGAAIDVKPGNSDVLIADTVIRTGYTYGIASEDSNDVTVRDCHLTGDGGAGYGIYWFGTATGAKAHGNVISGWTTARYGSDAGTTPDIVQPIGSASGFMFGKAGTRTLYDNTSTVMLTTDGAFSAGSYALAGTTSVKHGTGSPEGAVTSSVGSLYLRSDGGTGTALYVKESGAGNTGWRAIAVITATDEVVTIPAAALSATLGSPAMTLMSGAYAMSLNYDAAAAERGAFAWAVPDHWATMAVDLVWTNQGAGAGDVVWRIFGGPVAEAAAYTLITSDTSSTVTAAALNIRKTTTLLTGIACETNHGYYVIQRTGTDAADTLANDASVVAVILRRLT
jgi:hypothetical protein